MTSFIQTLALMTLALGLSKGLVAQETKKPSQSLESSDELEKLGVELKQAVKAGKLTEADAFAKWEAAVLKLEAAVDESKESANLEEMFEWLSEAVAIGKMSKDEAMEKLWLAGETLSKRKGNVHCPVTGDPVGENPPTMEYQGQEVAFCCQSCLKKFDANPDAYAKREKGTKDPSMQALIEEAVKSGKLTREEASEKMKAMAGSKTRGSKRRFGSMEPFLPKDPDTIVETQAVRGLTTPSRANEREGSGATLIFGWAADATHRFMDDSHRGAPQSIRGVSFRLDQREHNALGRTWDNVTVRIAHGDWDSIPYHADNHYQLTDEPEVVFNQDWTFPAVKGRPALTPASWGGIRNSLTFRFSKPWEYNGKDAIFLEFVFSGGKSHDGRPWEGQSPDGFEYFLDSMPQIGGWRQSEGGAMTKAGLFAHPALVPAVTSYAAESTPTHMSVWTAAEKGLPFIHYITD